MDIFWVRFRTQNVCFSPPFMDCGRRWTFFESDCRTRKFSFSPPILGCGRRWIFLESDFRTQNCSFSLSILGCGRRWMLFESDFRTQNCSSVHHLWVVADDGYFWSPIFRPQNFPLSQPIPWSWPTLHIFCESNSSTRNFYLFCDKWKMINAVDAKYPFCWRITLIGIRFAQPKHFSNVYLDLH